MTDQTPAIALEEEAAVLGAILLAPNQLDVVLNEAGLRPGHFYRGSHQRIYQAMIDLADHGHGVDVLTVTRRLNGTVNQVDIDALSAAPHFPGHIATYAAPIIEAARWRARQTALHRQQEAIDHRDETKYVAATTDLDDTTTDRDQPLGPAEQRDRFLKLLEEPDHVIPLPWNPLTEALHGGGRRGDTTILAAHSSHGKSVAGLQWLEHIGNLGGDVAVYTNEMAVDDLTARLLAGMTSVSFERILKRAFTSQQRDELVTAFDHLKVVIVPAYGWPWQDIARHIRRHRWDLCMLDLFNRLPGRDRVSDVDAAISGLCNGAAQAGSHLIIAAQLNQERSKSAERPIPTGRDLRESGSLYNDPANVVFVHQDQHEDPDTGRFDRTGNAAIWIDKARNGTPGKRSTAVVTLNPLRMRFESGDEWRGRDLVEAA